VRQEYEYEVPIEDAEVMLKTLCRRPLIEKTRHEVVHEGFVWHVDEFAGDNAGLVLAEIEMSHPGQQVLLPPWIGEEVTDDERYRNSSLVDEPQGSSRSSKSLLAP